MDSILTVIVGGKAGDGVKKAAQIIAGQLLKHGYHVFQQDDYQSLIKGGHNFSTVSFSREPVFCGYKHADLMISLDKLSFDIHHADVNPNGLHCFNSSEVDDTDLLDKQALGLPLGSLMKQIFGKHANVSVAAIALFFRWMGWDAASLEKAVSSSFRRDIAENIRFAMEVWNLANQSPVFTQLQFPKENTQDNKRLLSGNQAIALGAWAAGLDFYYAYPMTPASSILHYLAKLKDTHKVYAIHAESELAAANMAIGSIFAGAKTAIGSSGGGFALMQEAFSLAGMVEAPLLCVLSSRPGPATGVSTYTAQEDLAFALAQGHGEFGRIVASPDSIERAFTLASELLCLAWEFQSPVILLTDKHLSEGSMNIAMLPDVLSADLKQSLDSNDNNYARYAHTNNGVSPLKHPGAGNVADECVIKWNSHEHLPSGLRTDKAEDIVAMKSKRNLKTSYLYKSTQRYNRVSVYGESGPIVFAYGSTVLELREARKHCPTDFRIISLIYLLPFPVEELQPYCDDPVYVVEHSSTGFFAAYLEQNLHVTVKESILRFDGRPYDPKELATILSEAFNA